MFVYFLACTLEPVPCFSGKENGSCCTEGFGKVENTQTDQVGFNFRLEFGLVWSVWQFSYPLLLQLGLYCL